MFRAKQKKRALCYITSYLKVLRKTHDKECNNSHTLYSVKPLYDLLYHFNLKISQVLKYKGSITLLMLIMSADSHLSKRTFDF